MREKYLSNPKPHNPKSETTKSIYVQPLTHRKRKRGERVRERDEKRKKREESKPENERKRERVCERLKYSFFFFSTP